MSAGLFDKDRDVTKKGCENPQDKEERFSETVQGSKVETFKGTECNTMCLSSDSSFDTHKNRSSRKRKTKRKSKTQTKKKHYPQDENHLKYDCDKSLVKSSTLSRHTKDFKETIKINRRITKNTNLKTFPAKFQPKNQTKIDSYFKVNAESNKIKYFETFSHTKPQYCTGDYMKIATDTSEKMKTADVVGKACETIVVIDSEEDDLDKLDVNKEQSLTAQSQISSGINQSTTISSENSPVFKYYSLLKKLKTDTNFCTKNFNEKIDQTDESNVQLSSNDETKTNSGDVQQTEVGTNLKRRENQTTRKNSVKCPNYKIIEGTSFAVDAFRFGNIEGITHYFLTHFHADHYIGLKKNFSKPIYLSEKTGRLVKAFIHVRSEYLNVMQINEPVVIKDIEVTAIDANHCPGAVMLLFKFPNGLCTLHTGDFRASPEMEMEPVFWNNTIYTMYLDTTYLSSKYNFKSQWDSIADAVKCVKNFRLEHIGERILFICGSYVIGKEKLWQTLAETFNFKVWTDGNRKKALEEIGDESLLKFLTSDPRSAELHLLTMNQISYHYLLQYLEKFSDYFDMIFAIRPSGWEKNTKPQKHRQINIIGIEYSEHSSYEELRRFVRYLQPQNIISTVSNTNDLSKTTEIPISWFQNTVKPIIKSYQQSITNFIKVANVCSATEKSLCYADIISDLESGLEDNACNGSNKIDIIRQHLYSV